MHLAYLDETYDRAREHAVLGLVLPADSVAPLERSLNEVVDKAHRQHPEVPTRAELHGYELNGGSGDWSALKSTPRARVRIFRAAIDAIVATEGAMLCRGSVDLSSRSPGDAHRWALTIALECIDGLIDGTEEAVVGICDDVGNKSVYQEMYADARENGTGGYFPKKLESFSDGLHFTPSCHSRPVQAVDMLAYVYRRTHLSPPSDSRSRSVYEDMWESMAPLVNKGRCRTWG